MLHLGTILHPTDFSPLSDNAFQLACSLARDHGGRVIVLHVAVPPVIGPGGGVLPPPGGDWEALDRQLQMIQPSDPDVPVEYRLEGGDPAAEILRVARESHCDLIVLGSHGRTGLARLLMGSVADQIVRKAHCLVLVVKAPFPEHLTASKRVWTRSMSTVLFRPWRKPSPRKCWFYPPGRIPLARGLLGKERSHGVQKAE